MSMRLIAISILMMAFAPVAFAQGKAPPKISKAEVQKFITGLKADKAKLQVYCDITKLDVQANEIAQKNQNDPKLKELYQRMADMAKKLGPDYEKIMNSQLDQASGALFDDLSKSCNVGFKAAQPAPKASKADVQQLVDAIKADPTKLAAFCGQTKLAQQASTIAQKNPRDPKLQDIGNQIQAYGQKLGPDFQRIVSSQIDAASGALLDNLYKTCK